MIKVSICNFLILILEDDTLINIKNFSVQNHLSKWLRIINPFFFSKKIVRNLTWEKAIELIDNFVIQHGVKETLQVNITDLKLQSEEEIFSFCIQMLIIHSAFNDVHFEKFIQKLKQEQKECLLAHLKQFSDEFIDQIKYYFEKQKQNFENKNEILKVLVQTEKQLAEEQEKNKLLKASLEDRQKIKNQYEQKLDEIQISLQELQDLRLFNQEQLEKQNQALQNKDKEIQQLNKQIQKLKNIAIQMEDKQSKIYSDMSDMKDKIDAYENQIKNNRKKILENNDLHFKLRQNQDKLKNFKDLQEISHNQKYQIQVLESKNQENQKLINLLQEQLQKKEKSIEFFKWLQDDYEQKNTTCLKKIIQLEKDNKRYKAFNQNLMQRTYLDDKKKFQIQEQDTKIFRKSWIQDQNVQDALAQNYSKELQLRDQQIKDLQRIVDELQQKTK